MKILRYTNSYIQDKENVVLLNSPLDFFYSLYLNVIFLCINGFEKQNEMYETNMNCFSEKLAIFFDFSKDFTLSSQASLFVIDP